MRIKELLPLKVNTFTVTLFQEQVLSMVFVQTRGVRLLLLTMGHTHLLA